MNNPEIDYSALRPMDCVLTASRSLIGAIIRLRTTLNPAEMFRLRVPNHAGLIVEMEKRYWIVEALSDGIRINSLETYRKDWKADRILYVKRLRTFDNFAVRNNANSFCIDVAMHPPGYDFAGLLEFLGICRDNPREYYCSEFCEVVANKYSTSWSDFPLVNKRGKKTRISPADIYRGHGRFIEWAK